MTVYVILVGRVTVAAHSVLSATTKTRLALGIAGTLL